MMHGADSQWGCEMFEVLIACAYHPSQPAWHLRSAPNRCASCPLPAWSCACVAQGHYSHQHIHTDHNVHMCAAANVRDHTHINTYSYPTPPSRCFTINSCGLLPTTL